MNSKAIFLPRKCQLKIQMIPGGQERKLVAVCQVSQAAVDPFSSALVHLNRCDNIQRESGRLRLFQKIKKVLTLRMKNV